MKRTVVAVAAMAAALLASVVLGTAQPLPYAFQEAYRSHVFSRVSYCADSDVIQWSCGTICDSIPGFHTEALVQSIDLDAFGYVGVDVTRQQIIIAFRGTRSITNWLQNLKYFRTPLLNTSCGGKCLVHRGFYHTFLSLMPQVQVTVAKLIDAHPGYRVLVTGHSLGGALAMLAAVHIQDWFNNLTIPQKAVRLYSFGAPRVGNTDFTMWASVLLSEGPHYRITHRRDPVPHLPPSFFGFLHEPTEVFYSTDDNSSVHVCQDNATSEWKGCSNSVWAVSIGDHLKYLSEPTGCTAASTWVDEREAELPDELYLQLTLDYLNRRSQR
ncbi:lipase [Novymonas esmeraldas]|uniref:Lipase n=1 Tax=Novymonas esmeraldas TaxID=1808958 RepID=A0AAW0F6M9_9TRYP